MLTLPEVSTASTSATETSVWAGIVLGAGAWLCAAAGPATPAPNNSANSAPVNRCAKRLSGSPITLAPSPLRLRLQSRQKPLGIAARDRVEVGLRQAELSKIIDLIKGKIRSVGAVAELRHRHELLQRRHRGRMRGVGGVVVEAAEFGLDAVGSEAAGRPRLLVIERLDAAGQKRNRAAAVREDPFDVALVREGPRQKQAHDRARGVMRHFDYGRKRADGKIAAA